MKTLIFAIFCTLIVSCSTTEKNDKVAHSSKFIKQIVIKDTIKIQTSNQRTNVSRYIQYFRDKGQTYFYSNRVGQKNIYLDIFSLYEDTNYTFSFEVEGPKGIGHRNGPSDIYVHNFDSIFILSKEKRSIFITDSAKSYFRKIISPIDLWGTPHCPKFYDSKLNKFVLSAMPGLPWKSEFYDKYGDVILDLGTTNFNNNLPDWPDEYLATKECYSFYGSKFCRTYDSDKNHILYSFFLIPDLFIYDLNTEKFLRSVRIDDEYYKGFPPAPRKKLSDLSSKAEHLEYANEYPGYYKLLYDPYRKCIYRFVRLPSDFKNSDGELIEPHDRPIALQVIDESFHLVAEHVFRSREINIYNALIDEKGLWISTNSKKRTDYEEDTFTFILAAVTD